MKTLHHQIAAGFLLLTGSCLRADQDSQPGQLPHKMHTRMADLPRVSVGKANAILIGNDNRVLQAAVDYIASLGGGVVDIGEGEFLMQDSLHLRPHVKVIGLAGKTILKKAKSHRSSLQMDGDFGEEQFTVEDPMGFEVGRGVTIRDNGSGGFHTTVARITGRRGNTFSINKPLNADCMVAHGAKATTTFPVISGYDLQGVELVHLTIDGNKAENEHLNGCRGAGIFFYRGFGTVINSCHVKDYAGDGISFQQSNDVTVINCISEGNTHLGLHPGSGSQRPTLKNNIARKNGEDGLFLCWRVQFGIFENNLLEENGRHGISIGHKDTDNLIRGNKIASNAKAGIYFRDESEAMAGHRNTLEKNVIENNAGAGIHLDGVTNGVVLKGNVVHQSKSTGILIESKVGQVILDNNEIKSPKQVEDQREP
ncbi:MAG: parallel beta-helix repeat protein [Verrucomicrobiales bacterium]|jgi:parallel beta-helix repeat protein